MPSTHPAPCRTIDNPSDNGFVWDPIFSNYYLYVDFDITVTCSFGNMSDCDVCTPYVFTKNNQLPPEPIYEVCYRNSDQSCGMTTQGRIGETIHGLEPGNTYQLSVYFGACSADPNSDCVVDTSTVAREYYEFDVPAAP